MAFLHRLHKCRRNAAATIASAAFLLLLAVSTRRGDDHDHTHPIVVGTFTFSTAPPTSSAATTDDRSCEAELRALPDAPARCRYLSSPSHRPCAPRGYVHYLRVFYCFFGGAPWLGAAALGLWLLLLFYLLGDTASHYFCAALEGLSAALRLPPAIAGVTLLSLGNGAPDVLSSVVAFASATGGGGVDGSDAWDVGLSSVLGGALFVSTVVAGVVEIGYLLAVLLTGSVTGDAAAVVTIERPGFVRDVCFLLVALGYLLAVLLTGSVTVWAAASFLSLYAAYVLLVWTYHCCAAATPDDAAVPTASPDDPGHRGAPVVEALRGGVRAPGPAPPRGDLVPVQPGRDPLGRGGGSHTGDRHLPGHVLLVPTDRPVPAATVAGRRFLMSVLWSYMLARELVALLVSIGLFASVRASVLGATVLAWGDSLGDLVSDVAMAMHGGPGGAQTAVSGCYAGPAFNTVVGLGLSLTLEAGARFPRPYAIPADTSAYQAAGFLAAGLVWALVVLPARGMRLDRVLGVWLLLIYLGFLGVRLGSMSLGAAIGS